MKKKKYRFNPDTLSYEVVKEPVRQRRHRLVRKATIGLAVICVLNILYSLFFYTPKLRYLEERNISMQNRYNRLNEMIGASWQKLSELKQRDNSVYRALFAADTLDIKGIYTPYPDSMYARLKGKPYGDMIELTSRRLDQAVRSLYLESRSLDELQTLSKDKEFMAASIPAIMPINRRDLRGGIGAFGMRLHPIYHVMRRHTGIDLGGHTGSAVYATGNGIVTDIEINRGRRGYGTQIVIDHGFGYQTRYAHLSKILVEKGQYVKRGELIAEMGSTGASTAPHLHYEVIYVGERVNPINYFRREMSEEDFEKIIESAKATTFETDDMDGAQESSMDEERSNK